MTSHKVNTTYNLDHVTVGVLGVESSIDNVDFLLTDGSVVCLGKPELFTVFQVLASEEFSELCHHINVREDAMAEASKVYAELAGATEIDSAKLYDYGRYMKRYGFHRAHATDARDAIIDKVGWNAWVDACRIYECVSGTPREWLD